MGKPVKNTLLKKRRSLPCVMLLLATAVGGWNLTQSAAQSSVETLRWFFAGNDMGSNTYRTLPDGRFESTSEEKVANIAINSKLTGKITDGLLTEYELVNNQDGSEVKVTVKEGKLQITRPESSHPRRAESGRRSRDRAEHAVASAPAPPLAPCARSKSLGRSATVRRSARPHTHFDVGR